MLNVIFQDLVLFTGPSDCFQFVARLSKIRVKFWDSKAAFWRNSANIDFLENKSIFSQTKYAVIYFSLRPTQLLNMGEICFSAVATKCVTIGNIHS